jgi:hypothetical protein
MSKATATGVDEGPVLDRRAAEGCMAVLPSEGIARGAPGLYTVVAESGREYVVEPTLGSCECADCRYRDRTCKHIRRVQMAVGDRPIPPEADPDPLLGRHVEAGDD